MLNGYCVDLNLKKAQEVFHVAANRGNSMSALFLAQIHYINEGEDAPKTREWAGRTSFAMIDIDQPENNREFVMAFFPEASLSPALEKAFDWFEGIQEQGIDAYYETGMSLLKNNRFPESKIFACKWFYKAEAKKHVKARFQLARQLALGDGVKLDTRKAEMLLELSANLDKNVDAVVFAAQLQQQDKHFKKSLPKAYFSLYKAKIMGADVSGALKALAPKISLEERENAQSWAKFAPSMIDLEPKNPQPMQPLCLYSAR